MAQVKQLTLAGRTEPTWVIGTFAVIAALLAALGLYGVLSHAVNQRRREIGIRMALGARARDVLSHVLRNALTMILVGLGVGLAGAVGADQGGQGAAVRSVGAGSDRVRRRRGRA